MKKKLYTLIAIIAFIGISNASFAQTHPREAEVNTRIGMQTARVNTKESHGEMNPRVANRLHRADHRIVKEENRMENRHNGHITKPEQRRLNRQENRVSRHIRVR